MKNSAFRIATFEGDGIGHEIMPACLQVLEVLQRRVGGFELEHQHLEGGAELYRDRGTDITDEAFEAARRGRRGIVDQSPASTSRLRQSR